MVGRDGPGDRYPHGRHSRRKQASLAGLTPAAGGRQRPAGQWNESPQAQDPVAFGLSIVKPCFSIVSTKSMVAPHQVRGAHLVGDHVHAAELGVDVAVDLALVEVELVAQSRAAARLHGDAQPQVVTAFRARRLLTLVAAAAVRMTPGAVASSWTVICD